MIDAAREKAKTFTFESCPTGVEEILELLGNNPTVYTTTYKPNYETLRIIADGIFELPYDSRRVEGFLARSAYKMKLPSVEMKVYAITGVTARLDAGQRIRRASIMILEYGEDFRYFIGKNEHYRDYFYQFISNLQTDAVAKLLSLEEKARLGEKTGAISNKLPARVSKL